MKESKKLLSIDCSGQHLSLALSDGREAIADLKGKFALRHSGHIIPAIQFLLESVNWKLEELDAIAVGLGPGSFTGLRVALATAQGLSYALKKPLVGVSSSDALALNAPSTAPLLCSCTDARKGEVYIRVYTRNPSSDGPPLRPETPHLLLSPEKAAEKLSSYGETVTIVGSGAILYKELFLQKISNNPYIPPQPEAHVVSASAVAYLAHLQLEEKPAEEFSPLSAQPIYIRPSEAELNIGPPEGGPPLKGRLNPDGTIAR